jgi:hypothetical protein
MAEEAPIADAAGEDMAEVFSIGGDFKVEFVDIYTNGLVVEQTER